MTKVLIAEDERPIARLLEMNLTRAGYVCTLAPDGLTAADLIEKNDYDLALLDIMLPGLDGYALLDYLRPQGVPVIFLTAKAAVKDRVLGLRLGADDYIVKPFAMDELMARMEMVLRRAGKGGHQLQAFDVTLDSAAHMVLQRGQPVELTPREFADAQPRGGHLPRYPDGARLGRRRRDHPRGGYLYYQIAQKAELGR